MSTITQDETAKAFKKKILCDICDQIDLKKTPATRIPRGLISGIIASHVAVCIWLNRDVINNELRRRKKKGIFNLSAAAINVTTGVTDNALAILDAEKKRRPP